MYLPNGSLALRQQGVPSGEGLLVHPQNGNLPRQLTHFLPQGIGVAVQHLLKLLRVIYKYTIIMHMYHITTFCNSLRKPGYIRSYKLPLKQFA